MSIDRDREGWQRGRDKVFSFFLFLRVFVLGSFLGLCFLKWPFFPFGFSHKQFFFGTVV
jgi:hypothetical protein